MRCGNVVKFLHRKAIQDVKYKGLIQFCQFGIFYYYYYFEVLVLSLPLFLSDIL